MPKIRGFINAVTQWQFPKPTWEILLSLAGPSEAVK